MVLANGKLEEKQCQKLLLPLKQLKKTFICFRNGKNGDRLGDMLFNMLLQIIGVNKQCDNYNSGTQIGRKYCYNDGKKACLS